MARGRPDPNSARDTLRVVLFRANTSPQAARNAPERVLKKTRGELASGERREEGGESPSPCSLRSRNKMHLREAGSPPSQSGIVRSFDVKGQPKSLVMCLVRAYVTPGRPCAAFRARWQPSNDTHSRGSRCPRSLKEDISDEEKKRRERRARARAALKYYILETRAMNLTRELRANLSFGAGYKMSDFRRSWPRSRGLSRMICGGRGSEGRDREIGAR